MNIADLITKAADKKHEVYSVIGTVTAVNGKLCDVQPVNNSAELLDVRLQAEDQNGFLIVPKVDSVVIVSFISKNECFVSMFSEVQGYAIKSSNESLKDILTDILEAVEQMTFSNGAGPTGTPINVTAFTAIKNRLDNLLTE